MTVLSSSDRVCLFDVRPYQISVSKSQSKSSTVTKEVPSDLKVGYSILDRRLNYYCEQCNMAMLPTDIKIGMSQI